MSSALFLGSLLLTSSAQAMDPQEDAPAAATAAPVRSPQEPVVDENSVDRALYLKAEGHFRDWERGAREHDLTCFIRAIGKSPLEKDQKQKILGPLALLLADPENITLGEVERQFPNEYRQALEKEWEDCKGHLGITAAMCLKFYSLTLS